MAARRRALRILQNAHASKILAPVPQRNAPSDVSGESDPETDVDALPHFNHLESSSEAPSIASSLEKLDISDSSAGHQDNISDSSADNQNNILDSSAAHQNVYIPASEDDCDSISETPNPSPSLLEDNNRSSHDQQLNFSLPSLPTMSPMSNIPSVTPSFIFNQVGDSPQQSPQTSVSSQQPTRSKKADPRKQNPQKKYILNQVTDIPQQSPQVSASTPKPTRNTRTDNRRQNTQDRPRRVVKKKVDLKFKWSKGRFQHCAELEPDEFVGLLRDGKTTLDYLSDFFSEDLFEEICLFKNMYAMQTTGRLLNVTVDEVRKFIAIKVIMGIVSMPSYLDYWCTETRYPLVADIMPLKRYQQIRRYLHFVDNNDADSDPYFKIRRFVEKIRQNCLQIEEESRFSIDEMVIPYKGTKAGRKRQYGSEGSCDRPSAYRIF